MGLGRKLAVAATAVTAATALFTATPASAASAAIDWKPCPTGQGAECGKLTVPLDWDHPGDGTIQLALARRKATDPAHRIGSVLMDPGGPGGAGAGEVASGWTLSPKVAARFDTVGFDPRGVGESTAIKCGLDELTAKNPVQPKDSAEFQQLLSYNRALGRSCEKITGPLATHSDTRSVVRDMDAIRAALGDKKLTYYGVSYGTLMGQQYAEAYPDRVRALVLDSNMDHSIRGTWEFLKTETQATQELFEQFSDWCDRTTSCALHGQDVSAVTADLYARAERGELGTPDDKLDPMALVGIYSQNFYGPTWGKLAQTLVSLRDGKPLGSAFAKDDIPIPNPFNSIFCSDWRLPITSYPQLDSYRRALTDVSPDLHFSPLGWSAAAGCASWPAPVRNPQHPLSVQRGVPMLMLNSRYDPATPYNWAVRASQQSGAPLLTYEGWGHGAYFKKSQCVIDAADAFLIDGTNPGRGKHCPAVEPSVQSRMDGPRAPATLPY